MQIKDKIIKASWNHFEGAKNILITNILAAVKEGKIKVDDSSLPQFLTLLNSFFDEGYHRGFNVFDRELTSSLQSTPKKPVVTSKKN
jgi:hypothetical protein